MKRLALALALLPTLALAQPAPHPDAQPKPPDVVLVSRDAVMLLMAEVEAFTGLDKRADILLAPGFHAVTACIQDNPTGGVVRHMGPDQCPAVTAALAEREKAAAPAPAPQSPPPPTPAH